LSHNIGHIRFIFGKWKSAKAKREVRNFGAPSSDFFGLFQKLSETFSENKSPLPKKNFLVDKGYFNEY